MSVKKAMCVCGVIAICVSASARGAYAQEEVVKTGFVALNFGAQSTQHDLAGR